jgi:hypothetical protein
MRDRQWAMPEIESGAHDWPVGVIRLLNDARADVNELLAHGRIDRASELAQRTGVQFNSSYFPMYFTGAFESPFVLVHLNPKLNERLSGPRYADFDAYYDAHRCFGYHHWGSDPSYRSAFDHKQVRFLRPFGAIDFRPESEPGHQRANAALAIDQKLQLELIPYASPGFAARDFSIDLLQPHFERVLGAIAAFQRDYIVFCGAVFDDLLTRSGRLTDRRDHRFHLATKQGMSKSQYRFSNVAFRHEGATLRAGIAQSFATQGIPMSAYGSRCHEFYDR